MLFSEYYQIKITSKDDWFDPIIDRDTKLFVDPFLIFDTKHRYFSEAHKKIVDFFNNAFKLAASTSKHNKSLPYRLLLNTMLFPEGYELCLGYASSSINGAGSGKGFSKSIVNALFDSIKLGIHSIKHFEELGLFNEGIGCDRISDITINLIKSELINYTLDICQKHSIPTKKVKVHHSSYDLKYYRWKSEKYDLPINPYKKGMPILLVPTEFLNELPTISTDDFWDYCWVNKNEQIRDQLSIVIKTDVRKQDIIQIARERRDWVKEYQEFRENEERPSGYDFLKDPKGVYQWDRQTYIYVNENPLQIKTPKSSVEFKKRIEEIIEQFENFLENNSGYKLLWNDNNIPKSEEAAQLLYVGISKHYCKANNIDISREANLGRGPVDFKFSSGYQDRALLEVKLAKNSKFWNGLEKQLIKYLEVEDIKIGYFMVICYTSKDFQKVKGIQQITSEVCKRHGLDVKTIIIDATSNKKSASKL